MAHNKTLCAQGTQRWVAACVMIQWRQPKRGIMCTLLTVLFLVLATVPAVATDCGTKENPCRVASGEYFVALPENAERPPVVVYLHGWGGTGAGAVAHKGLRNAVLGAGFAFVAPSGQVDTLHGKALDWAVDDGFDLERDDTAFVADVIRDATSRFALDSTRILLSGYSRGGSMVWDIACKFPETASAYAAVSGGFFAPMPKTCKAGVHLHHTHGFSDRTVPLEGKVLDWYGHPFEMGDILQGLWGWRQMMGCPALSEKRKDAKTNPWQKSWRCDSGSVTLALHPGGHKRPPSWMAETLAWFSVLPAGAPRP